MQVCFEGVVISPHLPSLSLPVVILMSIPGGKENQPETKKRSILLYINGSGQCKQQWDEV